MPIPFQESCFLSQDIFQLQMSLEELFQCNMCQRVKRFTSSHGGDPSPIEIPLWRMAITPTVEDSCKPRNARLMESQQHGHIIDVRKMTSG